MMNIFGLKRYSENNNEKHISLLIVSCNLDFPWFSDRAIRLEKGIQRLLNLMKTKKNNRGLVAV
jgi:hypothetical protein